MKENQENNKTVDPKIGVKTKGKELYQQGKEWFHDFACKCSGEGSDYLKVCGVIYMILYVILSIMSMFTLLGSFFLSSTFGSIPILGGLSIFLIVSTIGSLVVSVYGVYIGILSFRASADVTSIKKLVPLLKVYTILVGGSILLSLGSGFRFGTLLSNLIRIALLVFTWVGIDKVTTR